MRVVKNKEIESLIEGIKIDYGIELNAWEIRRLAYYNSCFIEKAEREAKEKVEGCADFSPFIDALHYFMIDTFGLDSIVLGKRDKGIQYINGRKLTFENSGMNLLGTESFKEYCKRNLNMWRQERELI